MTETSKEFVVKRDNERDLRFKGVRSAFASSQGNQASNATRWTDIALYRTDSGKYVIETVGRTRWEGEQDRFKAYICDNEAAVLKTLIEDNGGLLGNLSKQLLAEAGIDHAEEI